MGLKDVFNELYDNMVVIGWNQTKMGLKASSQITLKTVTKKLKSDQDGIERGVRIRDFKIGTESWNQTKMGLKVISFTKLSTTCILLKSDQDGIESLSF